MRRAHRSTQLYVFSASNSTEYRYNANWMCHYNHIENGRQNLKIHQKWSVDIRDREKERRVFCYAHVSSSNHVRLLYFLKYAFVQYQGPCSLVYTYIFMKSPSHRFNFLVGIWFRGTDIVPPVLRHSKFYKKKNNMYILYFVLYRYMYKPGFDPL